MALWTLYQIAAAGPVTKDNEAGSPRCRYIPGDAAWPKQSLWNHLNSTVGGRLIQGTPLAQKCYGSDLSASAQAQCATLQDEWTFLDTLLVKKATNNANVT